MAKELALPFALDAERKFIEQVREMIAAAVETSVKNTLGPVVAQVRELHRGHGEILELLERFEKNQADLVRDYSRFAGWATNQGLNFDKLERKLNRIGEAIEPGLLSDLPRSSRDRPKSPHPTPKDR